MPSGEQRPPKLLEVVNLTVEDKRQRAILVEDRLMATGEVYDAEPAHSQGPEPINEQSFLVRTPVDKL